MRGVVSGIVSDGTYGQISAEDGQRYSYWTSEVRNGPVQVGQSVDFQIWEGQPVEIHVVPNVPPPQSPAPQRAAMAQQRSYPAAGSSPAFGGGGAPAGFGAAIGPIPSSKDYWIKLFTSPSGRVSRRQFWLHGVLPIVLCNLLLTWIPIVGQLLALVLLWGSICIGFKRFHDLGYPGWYSLVYLIPIVLGTIIFVLGLVVSSLIDLAWLLAEILWAVGGLVAIAQLVLVYIRVGQPGPNQYGPDPLAV